MVKISYSTIAIILTLVAVLFYGAFILYGTWSSKHPTPDDSRHVHAREEDDA